MRNFFIALFAIVAVNVAMAQEKPEVVPGNLIVQVPKKSIDEVILANQFYNGQVTGLKLNRMLSAPMAAYLLEFNPEIHHNKFLQQVWNHPGVTLIQLNHFIQRRIEPNDPDLDDQWWHINDGSGGGIADADIDSEEAWEITTGGVTATGDTIVVCVVDDGGDLDHPDLIANNWINHHEIPNNNIDDDGNGYIDDYLGWNPVDDNDDIDGGNHGVNVAGMIGAVGDNETGLVGVNWNVKIMNMTYGSIGSGNNPNEANVIEAYTYPLIMRRQYEASNGTLGAFVVATNSSWGLDNADPLNGPVWCAFYDTLGASGILSAGATANNDVNIDVVGDLPTACSSEFMVSVTATNNADVRTFSGYGATTVDLGAPGEDVRTTSSGGNYTTTSGTSFASPATAGAIALMYSAPCASLAAIAHSDPQLAAEMVRDAIFNGVDPVANLVGECVTGGRLNLKGALDEIIQNCASGGCLAPFSLGAGGITDTEADLVWSSLVAIDSFNISYGIEGGTAALVSDINAVSYGLSGLTECSDYWFIAQSICDGETSDWSDTLSFSTDGCCEPPTGITIGTITDNTAEISWSSVLAASTYELEWQIAGDANWNLETGINTTSFSLSGLTECTEYAFQLYTNCNGNSIGPSAEFTFTTIGCGSCSDQVYCESYGANDQEWIENVTVDVLSNTSMGDPDGYGDYTDMDLSLQRGETYNVSFMPGYPNQQWTEHFRLWIDLNQNGSFNGAERLFDDDQGSNTTVTGTISVPIDAPLGSTRMRVSMAYGGQFGGDYPQNSCEEDHDGEVEDYCVTILEEDPITPGIDEVDGNFGMLVYPTPMANNITIKLEIFGGNTTLEVLDMTGRTVLSHQMTSIQTSVDVAKLSSGTYVLHATNISGEILGRFRIVKN
jgi:serine protease